MVIGAPKERRRVTATSCVSRSIRASHRQSTEFLSRSAIPRKDQASEASQPTSSPSRGLQQAQDGCFRILFAIVRKGGRESSDEAHLVTPPSKTGLDCRCPPPPEASMLQLSAQAFEDWHMRWRRPGEESASSSSIAIGRPMAPPSGILDSSRSPASRLANAGVGRDAHATSGWRSRRPRESPCCNAGSS